MNWSLSHLSRMDYRVFPILIVLMGVSLLILSSHAANPIDLSSDPVFFTPLVYSQMQRFGIGILIFLFFAGFDYNKIREGTWILYGLTLIALIGLFFMPSIQGVRRWYRIPFLPMAIQPSEYAKLTVVFALSWFLEKNIGIQRSWRNVFWCCLIVGMPFLLILKQPDLGSALVLFPITLVMFYFGDMHPLVVKGMTYLGAIIFFFVALIFLGILPHETIRPYAMTFLKEYQFHRLDPSSHHQRAAATAISIGGMLGTGWRKNTFTQGGWLPYPYTDSVFPAFGEEFGLMGLVLVMILFYTLLYFSFQVVAVATDSFGRLLAAGIAVYLAMHVLVNMGMMSGFLPITGVPLPLITYGGSSIQTTMMALGILQSIYSRRFMF